MRFLFSPVPDFLLAPAGTQGSAQYGLAGTDIHTYVGKSATAKKILVLFGEPAQGRSLHKGMVTEFEQRYGRCGGIVHISVAEQLNECGARLLQ